MPERPRLMRGAGRSRKEKVWTRLYSTGKEENSFTEIIPEKGPGGDGKYGEIRPGSINSGARENEECPGR